MHNTAPYRVVQWTTGNVGKSSVEALAKNPNYELIGCYAWSKDKAGRDVGELVGIEPLGIAATNDVDALLALKPDCVVYNPMWIDVDELAQAFNSRCRRLSHSLRPPGLSSRVDWGKAAVVRTYTLARRIRGEKGEKLSGLARNFGDVFVGAVMRRA